MTTTTLVSLTISSLQGYLATGNQDYLQNGLDRCKLLGISTEGVKNRKSVQSLVKSLRPLMVK